MPTARNANIIVLFHNVTNDDRIPKSHRDNDVYMARFSVIKHWYRRWNCRAMNRSTLIAVIVQRETTPVKLNNILIAKVKGGSCFSSYAMYTGWTMIPTSRSEMARLHMKMLDGDRSEGVLKIVDKVKLLPVTQASINGTLRIQFIKVKLLIFLA